MGSQEYLHREVLDPKSSYRVLPASCPPELRPLRGVRAWVLALVLVNWPSAHNGPGPGLSLRPWVGAAFGEW